ncbi:nucleoside ABC transporter membrane protein [Sphaerochaeta associata]|uniref:ABC transporter permease n=2 Tax=root TaxID=1 RepID=A0ABY4DC17_9SPIR|nr:ABC transporter permease [Sphaerochaeta associata]NBK22091.1 ABC transporter permease [Spirochaetia bacterium]UOM51525.1 ABC transporter permease [Sphaerochaeta associata]SMP61895.1 nucleoside ABC transporter membrane protein [Sphaerochaeta associata]
MISIEAQNKSQKALHSLSLSFGALVLAILVSAIVMALCRFNPMQAFAAIFQGAFGSLRAVSQTLVQATPLMFTGLAFAIAKKASLINIGVEGQMYMGAIAAAWIGAMPLPLPLFVHLPLAIVIGAAAGALLAGFVGFLKVKFGSNEVIATIVLNTIAINITSYLGNYPLKADGPTAQTNRIQQTAELSRIFPGYQLTMAFFLAMLVCLLIYLIMEKSILGYEIRSVGYNRLAAQTAGINISRVVVISMMLSGAVGGLAGAMHVLGVDKRFIVGFSPGYGFNGISVAALAADHPLGVILASIIFGALNAGSMVLNRTTRIPTDFINVIQGLVIIFVSAPALVRELTPHRRKRHG